MPLNKYIVFAADTGFLRKRIGHPDLVAADKAFDHFNLGVYGFKKADVTVYGPLDKDDIEWDERVTESGMVPCLVDGELDYMPLSEWPIGGVK